VFSIHQLAEPIVNLTNRESKLRFERLPSDNGGPDTSEAKLNLEWKWKSNTKLGGYLAKAIAYFENILRMGLSIRPRALSSAPVWASL
jgi:hypothetical protein